MTLPLEPVSRRDRPAKPPLSRQSILDATLSLIQVRGVADLTLRQVAAAVETGPASLYAYFGNRDTLLEHALDAAYGQVQLADAADGDWKGGLAATIGNTIDTLGRYPGLGAVALGTIPVLPGALRLAEHQLALMDAGGISAARAALAIDLIAQFVASTAIERHVRGLEAAGPDSATSIRGHIRRTYESADQDRFPRVRALADALTGPDEQARRDFSIGVLLAGIEHTAD